jgi:hypothetical protein
MAGGVQRYADFAYAKRLSVVEGLQTNIAANAAAKEGRATSRREVGFRAGSGVISVRVGHHGAGHRLPWVDMKIAGSAVDTAVVGL